MREEMTISIVVGDKEIELPAKFEVCHRCEGIGSHTNPNIDGNGITQSEWAEICHDDPDFPEHYFGGMYDVTCHECKGKRVVKVVDYDNLDEEEKEIYDKWEEEDRAFRYEQEAEMRWERGCRGEY